LPKALNFEYLACSIIDPFPSSCCNGPRLWFCCNCLFTHFVWVGARCNCSPCDFEQSRALGIMRNKNIKVADWGSLSYGEAWQRQEEYFAQVIAQKKKNRQLEEPLPTDNYFFWVEHPPVFTLGKSGKMEHLLLQEKEIKAQGISFFKTNRGGDITFHGPGQIVGYPILDLDNFFTDIHKYLRCLEEVIIKTLADYGLDGARSDGETGVWLDLGTPFARKICAMGVRASRWVTMHGFAFNVNTDMSYFDYIVPCGIQGKGVTSLAQELKKQVAEQEVKVKLLHHFTEIFESECQLIS
jgi:lipoyl(octanoyl) transferase